MTFAAMFYLGSIARYRPGAVREAMSAAERPLFSELIAIAPKQFVYQIAGRITGELCVVPFSSLG